MYFRRNTKLRNILSCLKVGHFTLINSSIFKQKKYLKITKLFRAQSGRGLHRRAGPKRGRGSGFWHALFLTIPVLSCLVFWPLLWRPRRSVKNGPFHARKVGVAFQKGGVSGRDKRGKVPHPLPRPPGVLGWRFRSFSCRKIAVFADFRHSFFGCLVP